MKTTETMKTTKKPAIDPIIKAQVGHDMNGICLEIAQRYGQEYAFFAEAMIKALVCSVNQTSLLNGLDREKAHAATFYLIAQVTRRACAMEEAMSAAGEN